MDKVLALNKGSVDVSREVLMYELVAHRYSVPRSVRIHRQFDNAHDISHSPEIPPALAVVVAGTLCFAAFSVLLGFDFFLNRGTVPQSIL